MRIALLNTPYVKTYGPLKSASGRYFPLGLGYIAAVLRRHGHTVLLLDPEAQNLSDHAISSRLISFRPGLIGVSFTTPGFPMARHMAAIARGSTPGVPTVAGGVHAAALPEGVLREAPEFDIVCTGEGEETMLELAAAGSPEALTPAVLRSIPGIAFRAGERIELNSPRAWIKDLDSLPFPARELVDFDAYVPHAHNRRGRRVATAVTSRGCPYQCVFCASHVVLGRQFRSHSPEYIVSEIEYLVKTFGVDQIIFNDDVFTMDQDRDRRICELILKRNLKVSWFCFARVDSISRDILATMRQAGCFSVGFGVESGDPEMLKSMKKNITVERAKQAVAWADELGIKSQCFFVLGCPGETKESAERTIRLAIEMKPALAFFNMMVPYPGTDAFAQLFGGTAQENFQPRWEDWVAVGPRSSIQVPGLPPLEHLVAEANRRFYLRPAQIIKMLRFVSSFNELWQLLRGGFALGMQILRWRI